MRIYRPLIVAIIGVFIFSCTASAFNAKHEAVRAVWMLLDKFNDMGARKAALPEGVAVTSDIAYMGDNLKGHRLDAYHPETDKETVPVIVYIHGGGFVAGDKLHTRQYCMTLAKSGYIVYNVNYRLAPLTTVEGQLADIMGALSWIKSDSQRYSGDLSELVLAGNSAGAYLAGFTACLLTNPGLAERTGIAPTSGITPKGLLLFSGVFDLATGATRSFPSISSDIEMLLGTRKLKENPDIEKWSVTGNISKDFPKVFLSSGAVDGLHPETLALKAALEKAGISHKALLFDRSERKARHDYQTNLKLKIAQTCLSQTSAFLAGITKD